jgi:hypothetical protein
MLIQLDREQPRHYRFRGLTVTDRLDVLLGMTHLHETPDFEDRLREDPRVVNMRVASEPIEILTSHRVWVVPTLGAGFTPKSFDTFEDAFEFCEKAAMMMAPAAGGQAQGTRGAQARR